MILFDSHCHLDDPRLHGELDAVLARAASAGVVQMTTIGCAKTPADVERALAIARLHPDRVTATAGVHPHDASTLDDALVEALRHAAKDPLCVAIGETGLDFHYDHSPRDVQREAFRRQIALAKETKKPLVIHTREAAAETLAILREEGAKDVGGVLHCFSEDAAFAKAGLDLGFVASWSGIVTFKNAEAIRDAARRQPADALLVETDAPYLAPIPHRGKQNEPAFVAHTLAAIAALRGDDPVELARRTADNATKLFGIHELAAPT